MNSSGDEERMWARARRSPKMAHDEELESNNSSPKKRLGHHEKEGKENSRKNWKRKDKGYKRGKKAGFDD